MPPSDSFYFISADPDDIAREKRLARKIRRSQWWKNQLAVGRCHYCRSNCPPKELTMDHVVPLVRGGRSLKSNLVPCCKTCNDQKKYLLPLEWEAYMERLGKPSDTG